MEARLLVREGKELEASLVALAHARHLLALHVYALVADDVVEDRHHRLVSHIDGVGDGDVHLDHEVAEPPVIAE